MKLYEYKEGSVHFLLEFLKEPALNEKSHDQPVYRCRILKIFKSNVDYWKVGQIIDFLPKHCYEPKDPTILLKEIL